MDINKLEDKVSETLGWLANQIACTQVYKKWDEEFKKKSLNDAWINNIQKNPGRHLIKHYGEVYTNYGVPFSVDEDGFDDHTELFWKGIHTEEEIINLIKNDSFLSKQFNLK